MLTANVFVFFEMFPLRDCSILMVVAFCVLAYPVSKCNKPCGPNVCRENSTSCDGGYLKANASLCGCCPACVRYLGRGDQCSAINIPPEYECGEGLACSEKTGTCVPTSIVSVTKKPCRKIPQSKVTCSPDGTYAPRQCDSLWCYCVTPDGRELPYRVHSPHATRMECVCARVEHAITAITKQKVDMCDKYGNYKRQDDTTL